MSECIAGQTYTFRISVRDSADPTVAKNNPTISASDFRISINDGTDTALTNTPTVISSSRVIRVILSAAETTAAGANGSIVLKVADASASDGWLGGDIEIKVRGYATATSNDVTTITSALTVIDDFLDTEIAAILAKVNALPVDPADASDIAASLATITGYIDTEVASILAAVDTEVAAIKAKTDNLPVDPTSTSALNTAHGAGSWATATGFATPTNVTSAQTAITSAITALNNLSSAQAQTATAAALTAYDAATGADVTAAQATVIGALNALGPADITIVSAVRGNTVAVYRRDTWRFAMTLPIDLTPYEAVGFVVKAGAGIPDADALLYLRSDTGLIAPTGSPTAGSLIVTGLPVGGQGSSFAVLVDITRTDVQPGAYSWWLKVFDATTNPDEGYTKATGRFVIEDYGLAAIA